MTDKPRKPRGIPAPHDGEDLQVPHFTPTEQAAMDARPGKPDASGDKPPHPPHPLTYEWDRRAEHGNMSEIVEHGDKMANALDVQAAEIARKQAAIEAQQDVVRKHIKQNTALREALKALRLAAHRHLSAMKAGSAVDIEFTKDKLQSALAPFQKGTSDEQ